ncbi:tetratricopeptide repeat protein [Alteromonas sp. a30]|uniref:tetratricopeptide repeat protein n=1 Tax=Alteromonas sp. a30 TaxID=2730917 RepID=UPI002280D0E4|nr:AAA family ATPase [Alteromonas sp. a30]MCY7297498.1 AAA family ATPase [Alteromonas sp. a30]
MQTKLAISHELPDFPFINRKEDKKVVRDFIHNNNSTLRVMCLVAEGGVGKSRLMQQIFDTIKNDQIVFSLNRPEQRNTRVSLLGQLFSQLTRIIDSQGTEHRRAKFMTSIRKFENTVSNVIVAGAHAFGLGAIAKEVINAAENYSSSPFESKSLKNHNQSIVTLAKSIIKITKKIPILIMLDDLHFVQNEELDEFTYFLSLLNLNQNDKIRIIIASRPEMLDSSAISNTIRELSQSGVLVNYFLDKLESSDLMKIAVTTIENSILAQPLIDKANGNPQLLLNEIIDLNLKGYIKKRNGLLILPENETTLINNEKIDIDPLFREQNTARLLALIAFIIHSVEEKQFDLISKLVGLNYLEEFYELAEKLCVEKILSIDEGGASLSIRFQHDLLKERIIKHVLHSNPISKRKYIYFLKSSGIKIINHFQPSLMKLVQKYSDISIKVNNVVEVGYIDLLVRTLKLPAFSTEDSRKDFDLLIGLIRLCNYSKLYSHICAMTTKVLTLLQNDSIEYSKELNIYCVEILVNANYQVGEYKTASEIVKESEEYSAMCLYQIGMSMLILKQSGFSLSRVLRLIESGASDDCNTALLKSLHAIALSETGHVEEALVIHEESILEYELNKSNSLSWNLFGLMSALFWQNSNTTKVCEDSYDFFFRNRNSRFEGMALHNLAACYLNEGKWEKAKKYFEGSIHILDNCYPHESIFPENNLAAMEIFEGDFSSAKERLYRSIFRTSSEDYLATLRINLALVMLGEENEEEALRIIKLANSKKEVRQHTYKHAIATYAEAFVYFNSRMDNISLANIQDWYDRISNLSYCHYISSFWNALLIRISDNSNISIPSSFKLEVFDSIRIRDSHFFSPNKSLFRPCMFVFGHI